MDLWVFLSLCVCVFRNNQIFQKLKISSNNILRYNVSRLLPVSTWLISWSSDYTTKHSHPPGGMNAGNRQRLNGKEKAFLLRSPGAFPPDFVPGSGCQGNCSVSSLAKKWRQHFQCWPGKNNCIYFCLCSLSQLGEAGRDGEANDAQWLHVQSRQWTLW